MENVLQVPLDRSLQLWVLLPISIATLLMGLLRRNLITVVTHQPQTNLVKQRDAHNLRRSAILRQNGTHVSTAHFEARRLFLTADAGPLHKPPVPLSPMSILMNPDVLANQVTTIAMSILPHMVLGEWVSFTFSGVVVCRLPFTLSPRFRSMLQSGIEAVGQNLDLSYISSLSWYVLNLFGNAALLSLLVSKSDNHVLIPSVTASIPIVSNATKVFTTERELLSSFTHKCILHEEEAMFLATDQDHFCI